MSSKTRQKSKSLPARLVTSDVHPGRSCSECILCSECCLQYTHPIRWKNKEMYAFLNGNVTISVSEDSCICRNCRENIRTGMKNPEMYTPRWAKHSMIIKLCSVSTCNEKAIKPTKLASFESIENTLGCTIQRTGEDAIPLCNTHYRTLHRELNPSQYQRKCTTCDVHSPCGVLKLKQ